MDRERRVLPTAARAGITSGSAGQVYGAAYMLKALRANTSIHPDAFEAKIPAVGDLNGCNPDAKIGNKILEFKSWSPNNSDTDIGSMGEDDDESDISKGKSYFTKFSENSYVVGKSSSYTQFLCYLNVIESMDELNYYFDKDLIEKKGQKDASVYVKSVFKDLFTKNKDAIFNVMWNNPALKIILFDELIESDAEDKYDILVSDQNSVLYTIIKVK